MRGSYRMFARVFPPFRNLFLLIFIFIPAAHHDGLPFHQSMIGRDNDEDDDGEIQDCAGEAKMLCVGNRPNAASHGVYASSFRSSFISLIAAIHA